MLIATLNGYYLVACFSFIGYSSFSVTFCVVCRSARVVLLLRPLTLYTWEALMCETWRAGQRVQVSIRSPLVFTPSVATPTLPRVSPMNRPERSPDSQPGKIGRAS